MAKSFEIAQIHNHIISLLLNINRKHFVYFLLASLALAARLRPSPYIEPLHIRHWYHLRTKALRDADERKVRRSRAWPPQPSMAPKDDGYPFRVVFGACNFPLRRIGLSSIRSFVFLVKINNPIIYFRLTSLANYDIMIF